MNWEDVIKNMRMERNAVIDRTKKIEKLANDLLFDDRENKRVVLKEMAQALDAIIQKYDRGTI
jgi:hypothetical protein